MKVSVVLPTYNEAGNIVLLVQSILAQVPPAWESEILVVDDNSPDGTYQAVVDAFKEDSRVKAVLRTTDRGFAKSIRAGIEHATGDQVLVMDTDFTHDPADIPKLLHVAAVYDLVSGSRFCPGGNMQDARHYLASLAYNWILRVLLRTQVQDNLGGYFTIPRAKLQQLPYDLIFYGYGEYYFRLLHFAQKRKFTVVEVPSIYRARIHGSSKSRFLKMAFSYFSAAVKLKFASRQDDIQRNADA
jgi:dolichol-phosphate mannosyltransferase